MITWAQACETVGYQYNVRVNAPERIEIFYAYKNGVAKVFNTREAARACSKNVESGYTEESLVAHKVFVDKMVALEQATFEYWFVSLRKEHIELNDKVFNLCYVMACDRGCSSGRDEVSRYMEDYVIFANAIIAEAKSS